MPGGKCVFNPIWLSHKDYKAWIRRGDDKHKCLCVACQRQIDVSVMGEAALKSHAKAKKHILNVKAIKPVVEIGSFLVEQPPIQSLSGSATAALHSTTSEVRLLICN